MKNNLLLIPLSVLLWMSLSCSQEYNLATADKKITVGGSDLVFPFGYSTRITVDSLIDFSSIKQLKRTDDGDYYFSYSGRAETSIDLMKFTEKLQVKAMHKDLREQFGMPPVLADTTLDRLEKTGFFPHLVTLGEKPDTVTFDFDLSGAADEGLRRLDSIRFTMSQIDVSGIFKSSGGGISYEKFKILAELTVPGRYNFNDRRIQSGELKDTADIDQNGSLVFDPAYFTTGDLSDSPDYVFSDTMICTRLKVLIPDKEAYKSVMGTNLDARLSITFKGRDQDNIKPEVVYGLLSKTSVPVLERVNISGIPAYMRNAVLDLCNPMIKFTTESNATVPFRISSTFQSINKDSLTLASTSVELSTAKFAKTPDESIRNTFVISNKNPELETDYEWIKGDVDTLVHTLPTALWVKVSPGVDTTASQHKIYVNKNLGLSADYDFNLPLTFGPDLKMEFRDTATGIPDYIGETIKARNVSLIGTASSTLPVSLAYTVNMLDEQGNSLGIVSTEGVIPGTDNPDSPKQSEYSIDLTKSENGGKVSKMELVFYMRDGLSIWLNEKHWVQLTMQFSAPGGIDYTIGD